MTDDGIPSASDTEMFAIAVTAVNDGPQITTTATTTATEDIEYSYTPAAVDEEDDSLTWTLSNAPQGMTIEAETGAINWTPLEGVATSGQVTLTVTDDGSPSASDTEVFTVAVTAVNDGPQITTTAPTSAAEDVEYSYAVGVSDVDDANNGTDLTFSLTAAPTGMVVSSTGVISWTPLEGATSSGQVTLTVTDGSEDDSEAATEVFTITVNGAPQITTTATTTATEDIEYSYTPVAVDEEDDSLTWTLSNAPEEMTIEAETGVISWTPLEGVTSSGQVTLTVTDDGIPSASDTEMFAIAVTAVNDGPQITTTATTTATEDVVYSYTVGVSDADDANNGTDLTFALTSAPTGMVISSTGVVSWTPLNGVTTSEAVTLTVADGGEDSATSDTEVFTIAVTAVNDPPQITTTAPTSATEDVEYSYTPAADDEEGGSLTWTLSNAPEEMTIEAETGVISWTPLEGVTTSGEVSLTVTDDGIPSASDTEEFTIAVTAVNDPPVVQSEIDDLNTDEDSEEIVVNLSGTFSDVEVAVGEQSLSLTVAHNQPQLLAAVIDTNNQLSLTFEPNRFGTAEVTVTATDTEGGTASDVFNVVVTAVNDAPIATLTTLTETLNEDGLAHIDLLPVFSDVDGDTLTYQFFSPQEQGWVDQPVGNHGTATMNGELLQYSPAQNFSGSDTILVRTTDGEKSSNTVTLGLTVTAVNDAPIAIDSTHECLENQSTSVQLYSEDVESDDLIYTLMTLPAAGPLYLGQDKIEQAPYSTEAIATPPQFVYQPTTDFIGLDRFTFSVKDGTSESNTATVTLDVSNVNQAPVAADGTLSVLEDSTDNVLQLTASDDGSGTLLYQLVTYPAHGVLNGPLPELTYSPQANYDGSDSFTFSVNDGTHQGNTATVQITVTAVNDPPVAIDKEVSLPEDSQAVPIRLDAGDVETSDLAYTVGKPSHGTLSGTAPDMTYTPDDNYFGDDSFTFTVNDGTVDGGTGESQVATVSLTVTAVNDRPVATANVLSVDEDTSLEITLEGSDIDSELLTFSLISTPVHGTLTGEAPDLTYTPETNFNGQDTIVFKVDDGQTDSQNALIRITVNPVNDLPLVADQTVAVEEEKTAVIQISAPDADGDTVTFQLIDPPANGQLAGEIPYLVYQPKPDFSGTDNFTYQVQDSNSEFSQSATVTITVTNINDPPVTQVGQLETTAGSQDVPVALAVSDVDGDTLTVNVVTAPVGGTLAGSGTERTYTPNTDFVGTDTFTFQASDGQLESNISTVIIEVKGRQPGDVPVDAWKAWQIQLTASSQQAEVASQSLVLGVDPIATDQYDHGLDVAAPPLPGAPILLNMFSPRNYDSISRLSSDIIQPSNELDFNWHVRADENAFTLNWSLSQVPAHYQSITLTNTLSGQEVNMMDQASLALDKGAYQFKIRLLPSRLAEIVIKSGWNMISLPGDPLNPDPADMLGENSQVVLPLYRWNPSSFSYEAVEEVRSGQGYWILSLNLEDEILQVPVLPITSYQQEMALGWSMIGSVWGEADFTDPQDDPDGSVVGSAFQWNASRFTYEAADVFQTGHGYWVLVPFQQCQLTITASPSVTAAPAVVVDTANTDLQLLDLTVVTADQRQHLALGWHSAAKKGLDAYDQALPPEGPGPAGLKAAFQIDGFRLQRQVQPAKLGQTYHLQIDSPADFSLNWTQEQIPTGFKLTLETDQQLIDIQQRPRLDLPAGSHQLIWRVVEKPSLVTETQLLQNYPNPFNPETWIPFQLHQASEVSLTIFTSRGQIIRQIDLGLKAAGVYQDTHSAIYWDGRTEHGETVASGIYLYQIRAGDYRQTRKMVILK
ncbi:MAG: hypothetical protein CL797_07310 [Chromatiales bacterium]|nr:hypothetical protein [Chromatiales bacterium]